MIAMLDTSEDLKVAETELGCPVEQLLTPGTGFRPQYPYEYFGVDNFAFSHFDPKKFIALLKREQSRKSLCRFVAVPDVVGSARRTIEVFNHWRYEPILKGWPLALVAQDGLEDLPIEWDAIAAIFIGGSTKWKMSDHAAAIVKAAKAIGKWVHVGRVNTPGRFEYFESLGADSIDGSGLARYSWMRDRIWKAQNQPNLLSQNEAQLCS